MGGFCLLVELHWEGSAPAQQACLFRKTIQHNKPKSEPLVLPSGPKKIAQEHKTQIVIAVTIHTIKK